MHLPDPFLLLPLRPHAGGPVAPWPPQHGALPGGWHVPDRCLATGAPSRLSADLAGSSGLASAANTSAAAGVAIASWKQADDGPDDVGESLRGVRQIVTDGVVVGRPGRPAPGNSSRGKTPLAQCGTEVPRAALEI